MSCPHDPLGQRPDAADFLGSTATGYALLRPDDASTDEVRARFRDLFPALSVEIPVGDEPPMRAGAVYSDTDCTMVHEADTIARAQENWRAIHRSMNLVSKNGGGKVLVPDVRDGDGNRIPFFWVGDIRIPEGVELVIDGLLMVPDGGLTDNTAFDEVYGDPSSPNVKHKHTCVGFGWNGPASNPTPIRFAAISGSGIIDGNAVAFDANGDPDPTAATLLGRGNVGRADFPSVWLNGSSYNPATGANQDSGPAGVTCCGVRWGGSKGDGGANVSKPAPLFVRITGISVRNTLRSCFVGALVGVHLSGVRAENALTDHLYYFADADNDDQARTANTGANALDLHGRGYYWGGALIVADAHVHGVTITDVAPNPADQFTFAGVGGVQTPYATRKLASVVGPRHYKTTGSVTGLAVHADLVAAGLSSVVGLRGTGFHVDGSVYHTGAADVAATSDVPTTLVGLGQPYLHRIATGGVVRLSAHRLPGKTRLFHNLFHNNDREFAGLDLRFAVDYHPETTEQASLVVLSRSGQGLRLHVDAPERAPAGGGPGALVEVGQTTALAVAEGSLAPGTETLGPLPPALGIHDVTVSGRVQNEAAWCSFAEGSAATVSRLVARDLTVAEPATGTPAAARWHHERVVYLRFTAGTSVSRTWQPAPDLRKDRRFVFAHGVTNEATLGRVRVTLLRVRKVVGGGEVVVPAFGVEPRRSGTESAVYVDPAFALPGTTEALEAKITFTPDTYTSRRGSIDAVVTVTLSGSGPWYAVAHGLAAAPTVVQAVWHGPAGPFIGTVKRLEPVPVELRTDRATHVWLMLGAGRTGDHQIHLRAPRHAGARRLS